MSKLRLNPFMETPTTIGTYHRNWIKDPLKYTMLQISSLNKASLDAVRAQLKILTTGQAAKDFAIKHATQRAEKGLQSEWRYVDVDVRGKVGLLKFCGVDVALFLKRDTVELAPLPGEKPTEGVVTEPDDVWQRLDILGPSAKKTNIITVNQMTRLSDENSALKQQLIVLQAAKDQFETERNKYVMQELHQKEIAKKKLADAAAKLKPKPKKNKLDRLCMDCRCYENVHEFDKKGKGIKCWGGKKECETCTFRPKGVRKQSKHSADSSKSRKASPSSAKSKKSSAKSKKTTQTSRSNKSKRG